MSPRDSELEDCLKEIGHRLASPPSDSQELLLLLDKAEIYLSRVEQSPSASMSSALRPSMTALTAKDLLRHSDMDVKVAIASCLSEITRITAPDAPYDDDLMKEIFGLIVGAFKNLDDMSSRSFSKRVIILETVAKVRSCVLMLDLECDDLISEMFHHFLKTIRSKHSDTVFSSMETVMTLVIEETENISAPFLSCLLDCAKVAQKNILPIARKLAERVLINSASKLKPYLTELFNGSGANDYSKTVAALFQGNPDTSIQTETSEHDKNKADDHKLSMGTLSDDVTKGSAKQNGEKFNPDKAVTAADMPSKSGISNGSFQIGTGDSIALKQKTEFHQHDSQGNTGASLVDSDALDSATVMPDSKLDSSTRKGGRKTLLKFSVNNDNNGVGNKKKDLTISRRKKGRSKGIEISQGDGPLKEVQSAVCSTAEKQNELEFNSDSPYVVSVSLHSPKKHNIAGSRRGRSSQSFSKRNAIKRSVTGSLLSAEHKDHSPSSQATSGELPSKDMVLKESEIYCDAGTNQFSGSAKKSRLGSGKNGKGSVKGNKSAPTITTDSDTKLHSNNDGNGSLRKVKVNFSEKKKNAGTTQPKEVELVEVEDKELKLKDLLSSKRSTVKESGNDEINVKDTIKPKSKRKRTRGSKWTTGPRKRRKRSNHTLIGSNIKVWWPDDERFYEGVVDSFEEGTEMHKILYNDGDVEVLLLKNEKWEFVEGDTKMDAEEKDKPDVNASEATKKSKGSSTGTSAEKSKMVDLPRSSSPDIADTSADRPKHKGRKTINRHTNEDEKQADDIWIKPERTSSNKSSKNNKKKMKKKIKNGRSSNNRGKVVNNDRLLPVSEEEASSRSSKRSKGNINISGNKSGAADVPPKLGRKKKGSILKADSGTSETNTKKRKRGRSKK